VLRTSTPGATTSIHGARSGVWLHVGDLALARDRSHRDDVVESSGPHRLGSIGRDCRVVPGGCDDDRAEVEPVDRCREDERRLVVVGQAAQ
jgi:hypothetical protein